MRAARLGLLAVTLALVTAACVGETVVEYRGTVSGSDVPSHSFDGEPAAGAPIAGASVTLRVCTGSCDDADAARVTALITESDADGAWGPLDVVFGGGFANHEIRVEVVAAGFAPYVYSAVYETTDDPTAGSRYLNIRLGPG